MLPEKINRLNELARKQKTAEGLTVEEKAEQKQLRDEYRRGVVNNLSGQLEQYYTQST